MSLSKSFTQINTHCDNEPWSKTTWFLWLVVPFLLIEFVLIWGFSFTNGFERQAYFDFQQQTFIQLNHWLGFIPDLIWLNMTYMGDGVVVFALFSFLIIFRAQAWAAMFSSIFFASLITNAGKLYFAMPRPAAALEQDSFNIVGEVLIGSNSLPSGHSITITFVLISIAASICAHVDTKKQLALLFLTIFGVVLFCISRVAVGAHWPLDIIAGVGCGWLAAIVGAGIARRYSRWWTAMLSGKKRFILVGLLIMLSLAVFIRAANEWHAAPILILSGLVAIFSAFILYRNPAKLKIYS